MHRAVAATFGESSWPMVADIVRQESGFDPTAINPYSGACGLGQADPCSKLPCQLTVADFACQIQWEIGYFENHYHGNILAAYNTKLTTGAY